ncbi:unnamed protein product [Effrenium voratum]|uniref:J domain-containing protein n=1 Tax=Effrenium voratum TaxID=2562239 RepID=A0AA36JSP0_9DINO|nr:unnamed protein product [Effrenium voratum]
MSDADAVQTLATRLKKVIHLPLEYDVLFTESEVQVHSAPFGQVAGRLSAGTVQGYPAGEWLHLTGQEVSRLKGQGLLEGDFQDGWVQLAPSVAKLMPRWAQIDVEMVFLEALDLSWAGLVGEFVTYSVQWRLEGESEPSCAERTEAGSQAAQKEDARSGTLECTSSRALLHGLPPSTEIEVRVVAAVTGPEIDFNELEIIGSWTKISTGSALPSEDVEVLGDRDLLGGYRGGCLLSSCRGYLSASLHSSHAERCRRCGCSYEEHIELEGEPIKEMDEPFAKEQDAATVEGGATEPPEDTADLDDIGSSDDGFGEAEDGARADDSLEADASFEADASQADANLEEKDEDAWEDFLKAEEGEAEEAPVQVEPGLPSGHASSEMASGSQQALNPSDAHEDVCVSDESNKESVTAQEEVEHIENSILHAQSMLEDAIEYQVLAATPTYCKPSQLEAEESQLLEGETVAGFPALSHWIKLQPSEGDLDFVSHWVFQRPLEPTLQAKWCEIQVLRRKSGVLHVRWKGLITRRPCFTLYCLEWKSGSSQGCGLTLMPECTVAISKHEDAKFRVSAYLNGEDTIEVLGSWQECSFQEEPEDEQQADVSEEVEDIQPMDAEGEAVVSQESEQLNSEVKDAASAASRTDAGDLKTGTSVSAELFDFTDLDSADTVDTVAAAAAPSPEPVAPSTILPSEEACTPAPYLSMPPPSVGSGPEKAEYEVVHKAGVLVRSAPSRDARVCGRLSFSDRVSGLRTGASGLWLEVTWKGTTAWVLVDGAELGLGTLLRPVEKDSPEKPREVKEVKEVKAKTASVAGSRHAASLAQRLVSEPLEYVVLKPVKLYGEPKPAESQGELQVGESVQGYPGSMSWIRLARASETWAPTKFGKDTCLVPTWSKLKAENVYSEALEVSWQGLTARSPYVAAYSVEWRITPGEELPIGAAGQDFKKAGYSLSLKPRVILHGLPPGAAVQLRAGVRVASQKEGEADFRLLGLWQDFTTGSPLPQEEEREAARRMDPFGAVRGRCESSQCRGYVSDPEALASLGLNANSLVTKAICVRCGKPFEAHERVNASSKIVAAEAPAPAQFQPPIEHDNILRTYVVVHPMVFVRDRASVKGRTLGAMRQGDRVQGWPMSGWLRLSPDCAFAIAHDKQDAWILIHGAEVGLGHLLEEAKETDVHIAGKRLDTGRPVDKDVTRCEEAAMEATSVLVAPILYHVGDMAVPIHALPRANARQVGQLSSGATVKGFPAGGWTKLAEGDAHWVPTTIRGRPSLIPQWSSIRLQQAFEEALYLCWKELPSNEVTRYFLDWKLQGGSGHGKIDVPLGKTAVLLGNLRNGATVRVRVRAVVYSPAVPAGVTFLGGWTEVKCLSGLLGQESSRHGACSQYKVVEGIDSTEEERCRRCGHPRSEHTDNQAPEEASDHQPEPVAPEIEKPLSESDGPEEHFQVAVTTVYARSQPSTTAAPVGFVHKGTLLSGKVKDGWLSMSPECCQRLLAKTQAFVATEGRFVARHDLGALLVPASSTVQESRHRSSDEGAKRSAESLRLRAERACQVLNGEPLDFQVVSEKAVVRETPDSNSGMKSALKKGEIVRGFPSGSWLRLRGDAGWAPIETLGSGAALYMQAVWSKLHVKQAFMEAMILEWPGLKIDQKVTYAVEWRSPSGAGGHTVSKLNKIHLTGLPADGSFSMRVLACVTSDAQGVTPLRLNGPWIEAAGLAAADRPGSRHGDANLDPLGEVRGECQAAKCSGYLAPEDSASYVNDPKSTLCRRCGHAFLEHKKGEKHGRSASVRAQPGVREAPSTLKGYLATYVVEHRAILLRSKPSTKADKLGIVCKGQVLKGYEMEGWLQITRESSAKAGVSGGRIAWALIDGKEVGLGVLLRPLKPGETPQKDRQESDDEKIAWRAEDIYISSLEFEVMHKTVSVRRRPNVSAKSLGIVKEGDRVFGYPKENWLQTTRKFRQKELGWIRMDGSDMGQGLLLQCTALKPQVAKCFAEALLISWQHLPVKSALYTLEWMSQDRKSTHVALDKTKSNTGKIQGLAADSTYYFRVSVQILVPGMSADKPQSVCAKISSEWGEAQTGLPVDVTEQTSMSFDPLAKIRGKCGDCKHCENFILSKYSYLMHLDQVLCRRCGCACTSHEVVGEYGKSHAQWTKENAERRQREDQRRQAGNKKSPAAIPEIPCQPWQPDDAPAGATKVEYVIRKVKEARNFYETLGVKPSAAAKDIRNAYRQIALRIHPDKVGSDTDPKVLAQSEAAFKLVSSAYEVLGDEGKRASYNHTTRLQSKASPAQQTGPRTTAPSSSAKRENWPGGSRSAAEVDFTVSHAISGEELRITMNKGTSVMGLKRAMCKRLKRGPPEAMDICDASGVILEDDHRFTAAQALFCIGISLGPPKTLKLEVRDHRTGARLYLEVLDTVSMESLRKKVARELEVKEKEIQIGHQKYTGKGSARRFEALPSDELLNGRRTVYVNGNGVLIYLNLEQALQLQRDLIVAYSQPKFQLELGELLQTYPMPESITQMKFREAFGKLVRIAQKETLRRWGFEGDFAAQNMMTAFAKVGHEAEVYTLSLEIDKLLRITSGGMIAAPIKSRVGEAKVQVDRAKAKAEPQPKATSRAQETKVRSEPKGPVTITVRQAVEEEEGVPAPSMKVVVPADANMRKVKQAIAERLGMKRTTSIKLVFDLHGRAAKLRKSAATDSGMTFASFKDDELIGSRREVLMLGADLRQAVHPGRPAQASSNFGEAVVVTLQEASAQREAQVMVYTSSTMHDVKIAAAKRLERWDIFQSGRLAQLVQVSESIALLTAAMELLENPEVQERLMSLDAVSELLASWEPPWILEGFEELDTSTLSTVPGSTIHKWAESFCDLVSRMRTAQQDIFDEVLEEDPDSSLAQVLPDKELDSESTKQEVTGELEQQAHPEPEMEPEQEQEPDQDFDADIVMVEMEHARTGHRLAVAVASRASLGEVKAALSAALGLQNATGLRISTCKDSSDALCDDAFLSGRARLFFEGPEDDEVIDVVSEEQDQ